MRYYTRENQDNAAREEIAAYRQFAAAYPLIARVSKEYDGKCFNCRFEKALQDACNSQFGFRMLDDGRIYGNVQIYARKRYKWLEIDMYIKSQSHNLAQIALDDMPDGKRIPADKIIKSAAEKREKFLQEAAQLEKDMAMVDIYKNQIAQIEKILDGIEKQLGTRVKDIYNLRYRLSN